MKMWVRLIFECVIFLTGIIAGDFAILSNQWKVMQEKSISKGIKT